MVVVRLMILVGVMFLIAGPRVAGAQDGSGSSICPEPVSVCNPLSMAPSTEPDCPPGHHCTCVPSCPGCKDCGSFVCVADEPRVCPECRSACDCDPGLGCIDGRCIAGFAPVYCCEGEVCPAGQQCQHLSGEMDLCGKPCLDPLWLCSGESLSTQCGPGRVCSCTASCPFCEDCATPG